MLDPLCRTCGIRHPYGPCPQPVMSKLSEEAKAVLRRKEPKPIMDPPATSVSAGKFDRAAYQRAYMREYMRKKRAEAKK